MKLLNTLCGVLSAALMICTAAAASPDLAPVALEVPPAITNVPNPVVTLAWAVTNQGAGEALGNWADNLYVSTNAALDNTSLFVTSSWYSAGALEPGDVYWYTNSLTLPVTSSGNYFVILSVDGFNFLPESNETNNFISAPFTFEATPADLAPIALQMPPRLTGPPNPTITISWGVTNQGLGSASGYWDDSLYLSTNAVWTGDALYLGSFSHPVPLAPGEFYWQTNSVRLPIIVGGQYYLFFKTDPYNTLYESNSANNLVGAPVLVTLQYPDLSPVVLHAPTLVKGLPNPTVPFAWGVTNQGAGLAAGYWSDRFYLSTNAVFDEGIDPVISYSYETGPIPPGGSYWRTNSLQVPVTQNGTYYFFLKNNAQNLLPESNTSNNLAMVPVTFELQHPDLVPIALQAPTLITSPPRPSVTVSWGVTNQGDGSAVNFWLDSLYLSKTPVLDSSAILVGNHYEYGPVNSADTYWRTNGFVLPIVQSGTYYLTFITDSGNSIFESDTSNNTNTVPITLTIWPPDLAVLDVQAPAAVISPPNPSVQVVWGVTNQGPGQALGNWSDQVYFSHDAQLDSGDTLVFNNYEWGPLLAGSVYWRTNTVAIPITQSGTYYLIFKANGDSFSTLYESTYTNNIKALPISFRVLPPDLAPITSLAPTTVTGPPVPSVTLVWGITNQGTGTATTFPGWSDNVYLSTDGVLTYADPVICYGFGNSPLAPGRTLWRTNTVRVPVTESGTNYFIFVANDGHALFESDYNNNAAVVPVSFTILPPDLAPVSFQAPVQVTGPPNPALTLSWGVTNQGIGPAVASPYGSWSDHVYLSKDAILDPSDNDIFSSNEPGPLPPGQSYSRTGTVRVPVTRSGTYYLIFKTDAYGSLVESDVSNNTAVVSVTFNIQAPDLAPVQLQVPSSVSGPPFPSVTYTWAVTNQGAGPAIAYNSSWPDNVYLSTDNVLDYSDQQIGYSYQAGPIAPGAVYSQSNTVHVPVIQSGTYYLIFNADADRSLVEADYDNNVISVPVAFDIRPPDLAPIALQVPALSTGPPNPNLTLVWGVTNQGAGPAGGYFSWSDSLYLSTDSTWDPGDIAIAGQFESGPVAPNDSYWRTNTVSIPVVQSGTYYLIFKTDVYDSLYESDYSNNVVVAPVTFTVLPPDLVPVTSQIPSAVTGPPNPTLSLITGTTNQGIGTAVGNSPWYDRIYFSTDSKLDWQDLMFAYWSDSGPIAPGNVSWQTNQVTLPAVQSGTYYLIFAVNPDQYLYESDFSNNVVAVPIAFNIQRPDLAPLGLQVPNAITSPPNPFITVVWGVTNQGVGPALPSLGGYGWLDSLFLSPNTNAASSPILSTYETGPVPPGGVYWRTNTVNVPVVYSGTYYFLFTADADSVLYESDYSNNTVMVPISFDILPPDLAPVGLQVPTVVTSPPNPLVTISWGVTNQGIGLAQGYWNDAIYFSSDSVLDAIDTQIGTEYNLGPLAPGDSYSHRVRLQLPVVQSGTYYLIVQANANNSLFESDFSNNIAVVPITFQILPPDLKPIAFEAPALITGPPNPSINLGWGVTNQGAGTALASQYPWADRVYLSTTPTLDLLNNPIVWTRYENDPVQPGHAYWRTQTAQLPIVQSGNYYLIFKTDADNWLYEANESNNTMVAAITVKVQLPDLAPVSLEAPTTITGSPNPTFKLTWGVTNQGVGSATGTSWYDEVFLSSDPNLDPSDTLLVTRSESGPISSGSSYWRTQTASLPLTQSGSYYLIFQANAQSYSALPESNSSNNIIAVPITVQILPPDLAPIALQIPKLISGPPNPPFTFAYAVTNQGPGTAGGGPMGSYWSDSVFLLTNTVFDPSLAVATLTSRYEYSPVQPGQVYWRTNTVRLPIATNGTFYFALSVNQDSFPSFHSIYESDYSNNVLVVPATVQLTPAPDLAPITLQAPKAISGPVNPSITLVWGVTNQGGAFNTASSFPWRDTLYLSAKDSTEQFLGSWLETGSLPSGSVYWRTNVIQLPIVNSGTYRLSFVADSEDELVESDRSNNTIDVLIDFTLAPSDLAVLSLDVPSLVAGAPQSTITVSWGVTNQGPSSATGAPIGAFCYDRMYLSAKPFLDFTANELTGWVHTNSVPPAGSYFQSGSVRLPPVVDGDYYLILQIDAYNSFNESNLSNNIAIAPLHISSLLPDLAPIAFQVPKSLTGPPTLETTLVWGVTNQGAASAASSYGWMDELFLSTSPEFDGTESLVAGWFETNAVPPGGTYWRTNQVTLTVPYSATFYLLLQIDHDSALYDANYNNNLIAIPVDFSILPPDLAPISLQAPTTVTGAPSPMVTVVVGVTNQGIGPAVAAVDSLYVSGTPVQDASARLVASWSRTNPVPPGGGYWLTNTVRVPAGDSGTYYLIFQTDVDNVLNESDIFNNVAVVPITFDLSLRPDLVTDVFLAPTSVVGPASPTVQLIWHVTNQGLGPAVGPWSDTVSLSQIFQPPEVVESFSGPNFLIPGEGYWRTNTVTLPLTQSGGYYVSFQANGGNELSELDQSNNGWFQTFFFSLLPGPSLALGAPRTLSDGSFLVSLYGVIGASYTLQTSTNLIDWERVCDFVCTNLPTVLRDPEAAHFTHRFYRVAPYSAIAPWLALTSTPSGTNQGVALKLDSPVSRTVSVEASVDLQDWVTVTNFFNTLSPTFLRDAGSTNFSLRFYRAVAR